MSAVTDVKLDMGHMEVSFTKLATALDDLPQSEWPLFLAKVVLVLAESIEDSAVVEAAVDAALKDLRR